MYFLKVIHIYHFFKYTWHNLILIPLLISFVVFEHVVSPIRLRLHVTQEVPLPPYNFNRSCHIEGNVQLGWGEES